MADLMRVRAGFCSFAFPLTGRDRAIQDQAGQQMLAQSGEEQMKELLAQVKAEIANSTDNDPEIMRLLDEQIKAAEAAEVSPSQIDQQGSAAAPVVAAGRPRRRRR